MNHRVALYKHIDESTLEKQNPYDDGQGLIRTEDGMLEPVWSCDAALPKSLVDLWDTLMIVKRKKRRRRKKRKDEFAFDDFS